MAKLRGSESSPAELQFSSWEVNSGSNRKTVSGMQSQGTTGRISAKMALTRGGGRHSQSRRSGAQSNQQSLSCITLPHPIHRHHCDQLPCQGTKQLGCCFAACPSTCSQQHCFPTGLSWFNPSQQLSTTQRLPHSPPAPSGMGRRIGEKR